MNLMRRKNAHDQAAEQRMHEEALRERALRLVDTRGVVVNEAEAELQAAIAELRMYATPERERRVAEATRALDEARKSLRRAAESAGG